MTRGRTGAWHREYVRNRARLLATSDVCALCGHPDARTADHIVPWRRWPRDIDGRLIPGFNSLGNLQPAHGTMGPKQEPNRCPTCGKLCNQSKGAGLPGQIRRSGMDHFPESANRPASRDWGLS